MTVHIHHGNNLHILPTFADASFDSIVTDPPYELGFMGKQWDATGIAYNLTVWAECLRVLKPGGHLLAFGGTRTYHRMACAIEDAGFEIRDSIHWLYGSGFPKSLDVSKAIDKAHGSEKIDIITRVTSWVRDARNTAGLTNTDIDKAFGLRTMARHWTDVPPDGKQPSVPTADQWPKLLELLQVNEPPLEVRDAVDEWLRMKGQPAPTWHARPVIGIAKGGIVPDPTKPAPFTVGGHTREYMITSSATDAARRWDGWGTALKPAHEPIILARRPLDGTVAHNVLTHSTGALNINGCRVQGAPWKSVQPNNGGRSGGILGSHTQHPGGEPHTLGRWPANIIVSEELAEQHPEWAHYYYCPKASTTERNTGLNEYSNRHPTVKPLALMRWLCRLVTPPDGTILDPFAGSGTTLTAAILERFHATGIELNTEYLPIIHARTQWATNQPTQTSLEL